MPDAEIKPPWGPDPIRVGERRGSALDPLKPFLKNLLAWLGANLPAAKFARV